jgi:hypothetical protein
MVDKPALTATAARDPLVTVFALFVLGGLAKYFLFKTRPIGRVIARIVFPTLLTIAFLVPTLSPTNDCGRPARRSMLHRSGQALALWLPATILLTGLWQVYILEGFLGSTLAIGHGWFPLALFGPTAALALGLAIVGWRKHGPGLPFAAGALSVLLAMPAAWSIGTTLVRGTVGFPTARPPFPTAEAEARRARWAQFVGAISGDPKLIAFLEHHHDRADYLLATVNARQAAPIIIATGNPVMALGGFSGGDPILTVDDFARLVAEHRVRFALIGDGSEGIRRVFGEARQKPLTDWIQANGKRVDAARWRTPVPVEDPGAANGRPLRAAESVGAQLYDLRPADDERG